MSKTRPRSIRGGTVDEAASCRVLRELQATPELFAAIEAGPDDELGLQRKLRQTYDEELVRGALSLRDLRRKGAVKFSRAAAMWFDRMGLEQATSEAVARHKATRFSGAVDDLCCGIGGDAVALGQRCHVRALDRRRSLTLMAAWNAEAYGVEERVETEVGDAVDMVAGTRLVHIDPDRRAGTRRSVRIEDYQPGIDDLHRFMAARPGGAIKLSPASNFGGKFPDCEIELISLDRECKEAVVWFGELAGEDGWRATLLPSGETIVGDPLAAAANVGSVRNYLYDPDPAVVRSGLLDVVACQFGLERLDAEEEYLSSDTLVRSAFVTPFSVLADLPNNDKLVRRFFRERRFREVEIKCRRIPINPDVYRRKLSLEGDEPVVLVFARVAGRSRALVCQRVTPPKSVNLEDS